MRMRCNLEDCRGVISDGNIVIYDGSLSLVVRIHGRAALAGCPCEKCHTLLTLHCDLKKFI